MATTQIKGSQIQDGTITSSDVEDSLEKELTKVRVTTNDSTPDFLSTKIIAGDNITVNVIGTSGSIQYLAISGSAGGGGGAPTDASYVVLSSNGTLTSERVLTAGSGISITDGGAGGNITISAIAGGSGGTSYFDSTTAGSIFTSGSAAFKGNEFVSSPNDKGFDVFFYVSGSATSNGTSNTKSLFGGDVVVSGTLSSVSISGSLTRLSSGDPYLVSGQGITLTTGSNGSITIARTGVLQVVENLFGTGNSGTTVLPNDSTIPQNNEGTEFATLTITPKSSTSKLLVQGIFYGTTNPAGTIAVALFRDSTSNAIAAHSETVPTANHYRVIPVTTIVSSSSTDPTTFKLRAGTSGGSTVYINRSSSGTPSLGGVGKSGIIVTEFEP